jgi:hypothetical protein
MSRIAALALMALVFSGCASNQLKVRKEQRDKVAQSSKFYCDFLNGSDYPDIEVQLNLEMAKKCDGDKPMTMSQYRSPSDAQGILYCCSTNATAFLTPAEGKAKPAPKVEKKVDVKADAKADPKADPKVNSGDELKDDEL